jgi:phosphoserine phosphatase
MIPLCIDLDGTLIRTDMLFESAAALLRKKPWLAFAMPRWLMQGKAVLKHEIASRVSIDPALLPYNEDFLEWAMAEHARGRTLVLATASNRQLADAICGYLPIFGTVIASNGRTNQKGVTKLESLTALYGRQFAYAGNSAADLPIWQGSEEAILVSAPASVAQTARAQGNVTREFPAPRLLYSAVRQVFRVRVCQFILVAAIPPTMISHNPLWAAAALALTCLISGALITRDVLSLQQDRAVRRLATRAIASGVFPLPVAFFLGPGLILVALTLALYIAVIQKSR